MKHLSETVRACLCLAVALGLGACVGNARGSVIDLTGASRDEPEVRIALWLEPGESRALSLLVDGAIEATVRQREVSEGSSPMTMSIAGPEVSYASGVTDEPSLTIESQGSGVLLDLGLTCVSLRACAGVLELRRLAEQVPATPLDDRMVEVEAGLFAMGCDPTQESICDDAEIPVHEVFVSPFAIDRTEVSHRAYAECVDAGICNRPYGGWDPEARGDYPVSNVTWSDADAYCRWSGARLCTEAEWEKAARGPRAMRFPWGNNPATCAQAVFFEDAYAGAGCGTNSTRPVGMSALGASPYGALDMIGNVNEWVADWFDADAYSACAAGECSDPGGPRAGTHRVIRGWSWKTRPSADSVNLRASYRLSVEPETQSDSIGFRCCR